MATQRSSEVKMQYNSLQINYALSYQRTAECQEKPGSCVFEQLVESWRRDCFSWVNTVEWITTRNQNTLLDTEGAQSEAPGDVNDNSVIQVGKWENISRNQWELLLVGDIFHSWVPEMESILPTGIIKEPRCLRVRYRKYLYIHPRTFCSTIAVKEKKMNVLTVPLSWHRRALPKIFPLSHSLHSLICFGIFLACDSIKRGSDGSGTVSAYSQPKRNVTQKPE